jgi:hypothetical protein
MGLVGSCSADEEQPEAQETRTSSAPSASVTTTLEATTPTQSTTETGPSAAVEPNVGDRALRIGQTREGSLITTRLIAYRYPYPPGQYNEPTSGNQWFGLRVRQCLRDSAPPDQGPYMATSHDEWFITAPRGAQFSGGLSDMHWPTPRFPEYAGMNPGECLIGWMVVEVPTGMKVERIVYRPLGSPAVAEWLP